MRTPSKLNYRSDRGNILVIAGAIGFVILILGLWAIDVFWLHLITAKELSAAEKVAMAAAVALNKDDSIGQMNYMLAHSRELICCLRFNEAMTEREDHSVLRQLAHDLAQRAHDTSILLASERKTLEAERIAEAYSAAKAAVSSAGSPNAANMGGVTTGGVSLNEDKCFFGCAKIAASDADSDDNVSPSNVEPTKYYFDQKVDNMLMSYDKKFIDAGGNYYKGNQKEPLDLNFPGGGDDADLQFPLSSVPPCINNYISPPRLMKEAEFHRMCAFKPDSGPRYMPSAVYIVLQLDVKDTNSGNASKLMAPGIALTNGATPSP